MISDIRTVIWKERKGFFIRKGSRLRSLLSLMIPFGVISIYLPLDAGKDWVESPIALFSVIIPMMMVGTAIPDSFAGERERHTLNTLLASRLPDRAIILGKVAVAVGYGWAMTIIVLFVGLITVNAAHWEGHLLLYTPSIALATLTLSLLVALLVAGAGILISLRASTVQDAQQFLMIILFTIPMLLGLTMTLLYDRISDTLESIDLSFTQIILIVIAALVIIDTALMYAAFARFRRARLILD